MGAGAALSGSPLLGRAMAASMSLDLESTAPLARYWAGASSATDPSQCQACHDAGAALLPGHIHARATVKCLLCARACRIEPGDRGECQARANVGGSLRSLGYGRPTARHVDPIEKKPFYHFLPGSRAYSLSTTGCPLHCRFCQNWTLSQARPEDVPFLPLTPQALVEDAVARGAPVIAFTYNEPTVFVEYLLDIAALARPQGIRSVVVSCGYMNEGPLADICAAVDAIKFDLKGFSEDFYEKVSGASLAPVVRSIRQVRRCGVHLELVNLVVPTLNDPEPMVRDLCRFVADELGPDVPVHFTRFHPDYQLTHLPPTPVPTLERARAAALDAGLRYAYVGNVPGHPMNHTYCPGCGAIAIERQGFFVQALRVTDGRCQACGTPVAGVWA